MLPPRHGAAAPAGPPLMAPDGNGLARRARFCYSLSILFASLAQLVELLICNQQVTGSSPVAGSIFPRVPPCGGTRLFFAAAGRIVL